MNINIGNLEYALFYEMNKNELLNYHAEKIKKRIPKLGILNKFISSFLKFFTKCFSLFKILQHDCYILNRNGRN